MTFGKLFQGLCSVARRGLLSAPSALHAPVAPVPSTGLGSRWLSHLVTPPPSSTSSGLGLLSPHGLLTPHAPLNHHQPVRTRVLISRTRGSPRTVRAVVRRFFRLQNGLWIRPIAGRRKHLWRKSDRTKQDITRHLLCTRAQCQMMDRMVNRYFKERKYYVDDPYAPYHKLSVHPEHRFNPRKFYP